MASNESATALATGTIPAVRLPTGQSVERWPRTIGQVYAICQAPLYQDPHEAMEAIRKLLACEDIRPSCASCGCPVLPTDDPGGSAGAPEHCAGCGKKVT